MEKRDYYLQNIWQNKQSYEWVLNVKETEGCSSLNLTQSIIRNRSLTLEQHTFNDALTEVQHGRAESGQVGSEHFHGARHGLTSLALLIALSWWCRGEAGKAEEHLEEGNSVG